MRVRPVFRLGVLAALVAGVLVGSGVRSAAADAPALTCQSVAAADTCSLQHTGATYTMTVTLVRDNRPCADNSDDNCLLTFDLLSRRLDGKGDVVDSCTPTWDERNEGQTGNDAHLWESPSIPATINCSLSWPDSADPSINIGGADGIVLAVLPVCMDDCPKDEAHQISVSNGITVNADGDAPLHDATSTSCVTDNGKCTLRAAIQTANNRGGNVEIKFNIPGGGMPIITPGLQLPDVTTDDVTIDATTQPGGWVRVDGGGHGFNGLDVRGSNATVRGLDLTGFGANSKCGGSQHRAITVYSDGATIAGDVFGLTTPTGSQTAGNAIAIGVSRAAKVTIGGTTATDTNVMAGNACGVYAVNTSGLKILGNVIGTAADGKTPLPGTQNAVWLSGTSGTQLGAATSAPGTAPGNVLVGTTTDNDVANAAVLVMPSTQNPNTGLTVAGNLVGLGRTSFYGGAPYGIALYKSVTGTTIGGSSASARNVIGGLDQVDVALLTDKVKNTTIEQNWVNLEANGTSAAGGHIGIAALGATDVTIGAPGHGNVIAMHGGKTAGIALLRDYTLGGTDYTTSGKSRITVAGNTVGLDAHGNHDTDPAHAPLGGIVDLRGNADTIGPDNTVAWNARGIDLVDTQGVAVTGNRVGTSADGTKAVPNGIGVSAQGAVSSTISGNQIADGAFGVVVQENVQTNSPHLIDVKLADKEPAKNTTIRANTFNTTGDGKQALTIPSPFPVDDNGTTTSSEDLIKQDKPKSGKWPESDGISIDVDNGSVDTLIGGTTAAAANVFGGKGHDSISLGDLDSEIAPNPTGTVIQGNFIGVTRGGKALPVRSGIAGSDTKDVTIGGLAEGAANTIANGLVGILLGKQAQQVSVLSNSIYGNSEKGINDDYRERRDGLNAPIVGSAGLAKGKLHVEVTVPTTKGSRYRVQFFANPSCKGTDEASGTRYFTGQDATFTAGKGSQRVTVDLPGKGIGKKTGVTVVLNSGGDTSAFSNCEPVG
jgi:hypothetical protein